MPMDLFVLLIFEELKSSSAAEDVSLIGVASAAEAPTSCQNATVPDHRRPKCWERTPSVWLAYFTGVTGLDEKGSISLLESKPEDRRCLLLHNQLPCTRGMRSSNHSLVVPELLHS